MLGDWASLLIYLLFAAAVAGSLLGASLALGTRPQRPGRQKTMSFESGVSQGPPAQDRRFTVSFYLTAMLFILFDIEIVFLYPLAIQLNALGWFGLVEFLSFVGILLVAYVYIWRKGALEWH